MRDNVSRFVEALQRESEPRRALIGATEAIVTDSASELTRILSSLGVDLLAALRVSPEEWNPAAGSADPLEIQAALGCAAFLEDLAVPEVSSAALAHLLLRNHYAALRTYPVVRAFQMLPPLVTLQATSRGTVRLTRASVLSWGLPARAGAAFSEPLAATLDRFLALPVNRRLLKRAVQVAAWAGEEQPASSQTVVRATLSLAAEQRVANWIRAASVNPVEFVREDVREPREERFGDGSLTREAATVLCVAQELAEVSGQRVDTDRILLASLVTPGSYLERLLRRLFGAGVNLPLLYLRSARPGALSPPECRLLVAAGDRLCASAAEPSTGDVSLARLENLRLEALTTTVTFSARERLERYAAAADGLPDSFFSVSEPLPRGATTGNLRYFAIDALRVDPTLPGDQVAAATGGRARKVVEADEESAEVRLLGDLIGDQPERRLHARRQLFTVQSDEVGLDLLRRLPPTLGDECLEAADAGDAARLRWLVRTDLALAGGAKGPRSQVDRAGVSLSIGGGPESFALGLVADDHSEAWTVTISERDLIDEWSEVRRVALRKDPAQLRARLTEHAHRLGLDRIAMRFEDRDLALFVTAPFDALYLDLAIKMISRPRSVAYRVFGGGPGGWQARLTALARTGGRRVFVADPTASLFGAGVEAVWLAREIEGELVGGPEADRARVLRSLEAAYQPAQLLHFTGHGVSGLVDASGHLVSGVRVGFDEVLTASMLADSIAPRVLVASACDVACLPPVARARGWHSTVLRVGVGRSLAAGIPVSDAGALAFSLLLYREWERVDDLEVALARTFALGRDAKAVKARLESDVESEKARGASLAWLAECGEDDVELLFSSFCIASP